MSKIVDLVRAYAAHMAAWPEDDDMAGTKAAQHCYKADLLIAEIAAIPASDARDLDAKRLMFRRETQAGETFAGYALAASIAADEDRLMGPAMRALAETLGVVAEPFEPFEPWTPEPMVMADRPDYADPEVREQALAEIRAQGMVTPGVDNSQALADVLRVYAVKQGVLRAILARQGVDRLSHLTPEQVLAEATALGIVEPA